MMQPSQDVVGHATLSSLSTGNDHLLICSFMSVYGKIRHIYCHLFSDLKLKVKALFSVGLVASGEHETLFNRVTECATFTWCLHHNMLHDLSSAKTCITAAAVDMRR
ncbi:hypothetical protein XENOCAPTIV_020815 [Xenoophorus captivus]|uniref:Uncharacterized protein n=1 Tax=Xenoophorus captivus TaxID=1517983 RepID=A0ABV0RZZ2_9TELE